MSFGQLAGSSPHSSAYASRVIAVRTKQRLASALSCRFAFRSKKTQESASKIGSMRMRWRSSSSSSSSSYTVRNRHAPKPPPTASSNALSYASSAPESCSSARYRPSQVSASLSYSVSPSFETKSTVMRLFRYSLMMRITAKWILLTSNLGLLSNCSPSWPSHCAPEIE